MSPARAYYNDHDKNVCAWLRELIRCGLIPEGEVDDRSILDVQPVDLRGFTQCHFFAGIGGWAYALRLAGWRDDRPVWTGSPPCQPFSVAGQGLSKDDPRHLAPHFVRLVGAARPELLFGEQVASTAVFGPAAKGNRPGFEGSPPWAWRDDLSDRLEAALYAVGASDIPVASLGAPHIRQRTYFGAVRLADALCAGCAERWPGAGDRPLAGGGEPERMENSELPTGQRLGPQRGTGVCDEEARGLTRASDADRVGAVACSAGLLRGQNGRLADADGRNASAEREQRGGEQRQQPQDGGAEWLADAMRERQFPGAQRGIYRGEEGAGARDGEPERCGAVFDAEPATGPTYGPWGDADWLYCRDGRWRPVETGTFPLAHGVPARVGRLRGYGNAINPHAAAEFVIGFCEAAGIEI